MPTAALETLLLGGLEATKDRPRCHIVDDGDRDLAHVSSGDVVAYALPLDGAPVTRLLRLLTLPLRIRRATRTMRRSGVTVLGLYGIDPRLDAPACAYEMHTPAAQYADRYLRPQGMAPALRRLMARLFGCDPAVGAVVIVGQRP